ncbi:hypothetical protein [Nocardia thailandica]|uniref:hypothetical protein n=1 Tax=Nocardia thailandica TaxID=257275 RepID=UPI0002FCD01D|nr:hypothetical protein [Nocardia thailandica]
MRNVGRRSSGRTRREGSPDPAAALWAHDCLVLDVAAAFWRCGNAERSASTSPCEAAIAKDTDVTLPWTKEVSVDGFAKTVTLVPRATGLPRSAPTPPTRTASAGADGGQVTCRILVGDKIIAEQTANGPYASAGLCPGGADLVGLRK